MNFLDNPLHKGQALKTYTVKNNQIHNQSIVGKRHTVRTLTEMNYSNGGPFGLAFINCPEEDQRVLTSPMDLLPASLPVLIELCCQESQHLRIFQSCSSAKAILIISTNFLVGLFFSNVREILQCATFIFILFGNFLQ